MTPLVDLLFETDDEIDRSATLDKKACKWKANVTVPWIDPARACFAETSPVTG